MFTCGSLASLPAGLGIEAVADAQTVSMVRGSVGSSSILARSFLVNTVMELVSPTNSGPQAASTSCSRESTVPGLAASVARILNSFGVSARVRRPKVGAVLGHI